MTPADLHAAVHAAVTARKTLAEAATPGPWTLGRGEIKAEAGCRERVLASIGAYNCIWPTAEDLAHIVANDPQATIRHCETDLATLEDHKPRYDAEWTSWYCMRCDADESPCGELTRRAHAYGVEVADG